MLEADAEAATPRSAARLAPAAAALADPAVLRPRLLAAMRDAVRGYRAAAGEAGAGGELKLTVLVTWAGCSEHEAPDDGAAAPPPSDVWVHVSALPPRPQPPVRVAMRGAPRQNAAAKDSEWVRQRKALEVGLPPGTNEVRLPGCPA